MKTRQLIHSALAVIGEGGFDGVSVRAESLGEALETLGVYTNLPPTIRHRLAQELRRQELITETKESDMITLQLSVRGIHRLQRLEISALKIATPQAWDHLWRMVMFDIPARRQESRYILTSELRRLGFVMVQKSMWLHPYPCYEVVQQVVDYANLQQFVSIAEISHLDSHSTSQMIRRYPELRG